MGFRGLAEAAALRRSPFLDGFSLPDSQAYDDWLLEERRAWDHRAVEVLRSLQESGGLERQTETAGDVFPIPPLVQGVIKGRLVRLPEPAWTNGKAERFVQTLKDALEGMLRKKHYGNIAELQADLDRWLTWYNTERSHQGRHNRGRPPLQVIREFQAQQGLKAA